MWLCVCQESAKGSSFFRRLRSGAFGQLGWHVARVRSLRISFIGFLLLLLDLSSFECGDAEPCYRGIMSLQAARVSRDLGARLARANLHFDSLPCTRSF